MSDRAGRPHRLLLGALLAVLAAFAGAVGDGFLYDDFHLIAENPAVLTHDWVGVWTSGEAASRDPHGRGFRPVTLTSYVVDHAVGDGRPAVYHATQLGLHAVVVVLVYLVAGAIGLAPRWAVVAALLAGLHPTQTEAVHYLSARSSVLSTLWLLASVWMYIRWRAHPGRRGVWCAASLACLALAVWSKESAVVGVVWFIAYERLVAEGTWGETGRRVGLHAAVAAISVLPAVLVLRGAEGGAAVTAGTATATGIVAIGRHLWTILVPIGVTPVFPVRWVGWDQVAVWGAGTLLLAACAVVYLLRTRLPRAAWGIACGVSGLAPVMALPFVTNVALFQPHRGYQTVVALMLAAATVLAAAEARVVSGSRSDAGRRRLRTLLWTGAVALTAVLVSAHAWAGRIWRDEVGYWAWAVARYPGEPAYYQSLGAARLRSGDAPGALRELSAALALDPELPRASYNLGIVYTTLGRDDEAMSAYQRAVASDASDVKAWANLGWLFERRGEIDQALVAYRAALAVAPNLARVRDRVAVLNGARARGEPGHAVEGGAP